jgi:hypothetical protein
VLGADKSSDSFNYNLGEKKTRKELNAEAQRTQRRVELDEACAGAGSGWREKDGGGAVELRSRESGVKPPHSKGRGLQEGVQGKRLTNARKEQSKA